MKALEALEFDNRYARLPQAFFKQTAPTPLHGAFVATFNADAAALLDLAPDESVRAEFLACMSGQRLLPGMEPLAMCYAGHQFGTYVARLGDGRALLLGQVRNDAGQSWDLHLKGGGPTPYSRGGDGRAVLRSTIREYLCSEAMHGLGIASSRALCIIGSDEEVYREQIETGAMLVRLAPSHVRFGSFEYFYHTEQFDHLQRLADHVIDDHFPQLQSRQDKYLALLGEVIRRTAALIAHWQAVGFAHGVLNTDNMSILGLTLDYGPFGFLDRYQPGFVCNHSDHQGRYAFDQQPNVGLFNLSCLAQAMLPLLSDEPAHAVEQAKDQLQTYETTLADEYAQLMRAKLGLQSSESGDQALCAELLQHMADDDADYTLTFRALAELSAAGESSAAPFCEHFRRHDAIHGWTRRYVERFRRENADPTERRARMQCANPKYILRNHLAETAIRAAVDHGDFSEVERLRALLTRPYDEQPGMQHYAAPPPDWARHIAVSCSS